MVDLRLFKIAHKWWFVGEDYSEEEMDIFAEDMDEAEEIGRKILIEKCKMESFYNETIRWKLTKISEMKIAKGVVKPMMCRVMGNGE